MAHYGLEVPAMRGSRIGGMLSSGAEAREKGEVNVGPKGPTPLNDENETLSG
jgi:hypothetical protein